MVENETDKSKKKSSLSKILGVVETGVAGGFTSIRYVRALVREKVLHTFAPDYLEMSDKQIEIAPKVEKDLHDPSTVLGTAYEKVKKTPRGEKLLDSFKDPEKAARAQDLFSSLVAKEVPLKEKALMRNLHFTHAEKTKVGLVFAVVGGISGYAVYKMASWVHTGKKTDTPER